MKDDQCAEDSSSVARGKKGVLLIVGGTREVYVAPQCKASGKGAGLEVDCIRRKKIADSRLLVLLGGRERVDPGALAQGKRGGGGSPRLV